MILHYQRALDIGADGVIIPMINIKMMQKSNSIFLPTFGTRGVGLFRAQEYGFDFENYVTINQKIEFIAQIEHIENINNLDNFSLENVRDNNRFI